MSKHLRIALLSILFIASLLLIGLWSSRPSQPEATRADLHRWLERKAVLTLSAQPTPYDQVWEVSGTVLEAKEVRHFQVTTHLNNDEFKSLLAYRDARLQVPGKGWRQHAVQVIPTILMGGLVIGLVIYQLRMGGSKNARRLREKPTVRFCDVAGVEEAKHELQDVVEFLKNPKKFKKLGGRLPKGILLIGPPGTGKTLLAKAIAGEANANFFSAHGSDFNEVYVGVGAKRIREIFRQAVKAKPSIIFLDEVDCLGRKRQMDTHGEMQQTMNALLAAMDGFESCEGVLVLAATNRPQDLDEALLRPGRFDRKVHVLLPDRKGRRAILETHSHAKPIASRDHALEVIAQTTHEMSGADLASVINEAAILSAQRSRDEITLPDLEESRDKVRWGKERKSLVLKKEEREMVAYHEAGHTMINLQKSLLPPLYKVSIIPRGQALGVTTLLPIEDQNIHSKTFMLEELVVLMGGRAAEKVFYGATTNGAHGDLQTAKNLARQMIHDWGMGERLYYEAEQKDAEQEINRLLEQADHEALEIIQREKDATHTLAQALLKHETLTRAEVVALLFEGKHPNTELKPVLN